MANGAQGLVEAVSVRNSENELLKESSAGVIDLESKNV